MLLEAQRRLHAALVACGEFGVGDLARVYFGQDPGGTPAYPQCVYDVSNLQDVPEVQRPGVNLGSVEFTLAITVEGEPTEALRIADRVHDALEAHAIMEARAAVFTTSEAYTSQGTALPSGLYQLRATYFIDPDGEPQDASDY